MQLNTFLNFLQASWLATLVDGSRYIAMAIQIFHILSFTFLLALVLAFNIRLLRISLLSVPLASLARALHKPFWMAFTVAIGAGILLFLPRATTYAGNSAFVVKMIVLLLAGVSQILLLRHAFALSSSAASRSDYVLHRVGKDALPAGGAALAGMGGAFLSVLPEASLPLISNSPARTGEASLPFRVLALLALVLWLATGVAGRAIGFV